ncbi:MAG: glycerol-3-phosphate dehydrogenase [candidate division Zixibacteria bacterium RBG-1]|nr:MAG: glycerol-3-phosphate dehydrogenase [candidate division Zixibacteria bacterium RBG-1]OGC84091.1 MAG: glycerol-3-phosphate dehydrogenase [candidate division Zixibacteria bacterium RBG_19FT_COMBO_42_43]
MSKIAVLGAGSWGIAISVLVTDNSHNVTLWEVDSDQARRLEKEREDKQRLPGIKIPSAVKITSNLEEAVSGKELLALALPSHVVRKVAQNLAKIVLEIPIVLNLAKGIETQSLCRMSEVLKQELPEKLHKNICTLSGPSHAEEVSRKIATSVVVAGFKEETAQKTQEIFMNSYFRVYTNSDLVGVELGGSLKNIIAIASGICDGLGLGDNTKGALLTRGLAEMMRLAEKLGAKSSTLAGLSGIGDLITTCISKYSRNRFVGEEIGKGRNLAEVLKSMVMVAEGIKTTESAYRLAQKYLVEMPITEQMYKILFENKNSKAAVLDLMKRDPKSEIWS